MSGVHTHFHCGHCNEVIATTSGPEPIPCPKCNKITNVPALTEIAYRDVCPNCGESDGVAKCKETRGDLGCFAMLLWIAACIFLIVPLFIFVPYMFLKRIDRAYKCVRCNYQWWNPAKMWLIG